MSMSDQLRCPRCGSTDSIDVAVLTYARYVYEGEDGFQTDIDSALLKDHEWDDDSPCLCTDCGFTGRAADFKSRRKRYHAALRIPNIELNEGDKESLVEQLLERLGVPSFERDHVTVVDADSGREIKE